MTTAAIYARVSSARQRDEQTIASQTAALRAHAAAKGFAIPPEWVFEDEGYSGATLIRPALERLRDLAAEVGIPVLLVYAPDRLARRYAYQVLLLEEFARGGTEVRFLQGAKANTPEEELLLQFQGMIAEYERAQIAERTRRGRLHRARAGFASALSGAPYGYRYVRKSDGGEARYEIVESHASVVRELFRRYVEEQGSIYGLTAWLRAQGIPTPQGNSSFWNRGTVWKMLRNPAYCGRAAFGKRQCTDQPARAQRRRGRPGVRRAAVRARPPEEWIAIPVPAIVSEELFELAQRRLEDNKRFASRRTKVPSLLQGLVACEVCGYRCCRVAGRGGSSSRVYYYYRCLGTDGQRFERGKVCANRPVRADYLDDLVWEHVTALLAQPHLIRGELDRRLQERGHASTPAQETSRIERELRRTSRARDRLVAAYQEELILLDELRRRMPELRSRELTLQDQLEALQAHALDRESYLQLAETLERFLARLRSAAESLSIQDRQRVVRLLVKEVVVGPDRVVIRHSIPTGHPGPEGGSRLCCRDLRARRLPVRGTGLPRAAQSPEPPHRVPLGRGAGRAVEPRHAVRVSPPPRGAREARADGEHSRRSAR
jgi:site-specific DNA recombinase